MASSERARPVVVTGATGYIGSRLVPRLLAAGHRVRCLVRNPRKLESRPWYRDSRVEVVACDLDDPEATAAALADCWAAFYLVHSMMSAGADYADADQRLARRFALAAEAASVSRIIYLGGLGEIGEGLSEHLASRRDVEYALDSGAVPVTVLRAAMIIGSGSASFEILRYLVERLPLMLTPKWVRTECQPIGVSDVLHYLCSALTTPETSGRTIDIGGPDVLTYADIVQLMAAVRGLPRRWIVPVPLLTPRLSSLWIHLVTPLSAKIARPLAEGLRNRVVCRNDTALQLMPHECSSIRRAIERALSRIDKNQVESRWSDAGVVPGDPDWAGGTTFVDPRTIEIDAPPAAVFRAVCRVGGGHGWYAADTLWRLRGQMDRWIGGPGLRRGRRNQEVVSYGEALDFWRVVGVDQDRSLRLRAEMKLPGVATLEFELTPLAGGQRCRMQQTARFMPRGLAGLAYWYAVLPLHGIVFRGMMAGIRRAAEHIAAEQVTAKPDAAATPDPATPEGGEPLASEAPGAEQAVAAVAPTNRR